MLVINGFALRHLLVKERQRYFTGADDGHQLFQVGHLPCIGRLVPQHPHMMGQAAPMNIVGPLAQQVEHLRKSQGHKEVVGWRGIGNGKENRRFSISDAVEGQLVIAHDLPKLGDVKGGQPGAAGDKDRLRRFAAGQFVLFILLDRKAIRLALFQALEHIVHRVHKVFVVLFHLHAGDHIHQGIHIPILGGALENDIGDKGAVQKRFRLRPKWISLLAFAFGVGYEGIDKL